MKTFLDWSSYENAGVGDAYADIPKHGGDFAKAVAVCINSRHCETKPKGVMCPSYRIRDEAVLSTGGRVRLLKAALNSDNPEQAIDDAALRETMDLCLSCKGCKRECENEVDMAMIKIEYLAQQHARHPIPLRTRLFARLPQLLARLSGLRWLIGLRNRSALLARLMERLLKISHRRQLPLPSTHPFRPDDVVSPETRKQKVVLFVDSFNRQFHPETAEAAVDVLQRGGYQVIVAEDAASSPLCCGRTELAHGLVAEARSKAERVISALLPYAEQGLAIVGLEPACLLAIRDDYRFLGLGERADKVAAQAILFEEFIAKETSAKRLQLPLASIEQSAPVLIHGHCHQKAVGAMKSMRKVLKQIPELKFELIESSCCGMAGSFGLETEHVEDSLAMAELSLLPAIREQAQSIIVANGFSCQHQILEGSERQAIHIAQLLQQSLNRTEARQSSSPVDVL